MLVKHAASASVCESPNTQKQCWAVVHSEGLSMAAEATARLWSQVGLAV